MKYIEEDRKNTQDKPLSTADKILKATLELMYKHGYKGTTTRMIASAAGVNEATIFRIFKNKEGILAELTKRNEHCNGRLLEFFDREFCSAEDFLDEFSRFFLEGLKERKEALILSIKGTGNSAESNLQTSFMKLLVSVTQLLSEKFRKLNKQGLIKEADYETAAFMFLHSLVGGFMFLNTLGESHFPVDMERLRKYSCEILLKGIEENRK